MCFEKEVWHVHGVVNTWNSFPSTVLLLAEVVVPCCMPRIVSLTMPLGTVRSINVFKDDCIVPALMSRLGSKYGWPIVRVVDVTLQE